MEEIGKINLFSAYELKVKEIQGRPKRQVCKIEREYLLECYLGEFPLCFGLVTIDVDIDSGRSYLEIFQLSEEQADLWVPSVGAVKMNIERMDIKTENTFRFLLDMMLERRQTNLVMEFMTPKKTLYEDAESQYIMGQKQSAR